MKVSTEQFLMRGDELCHEPTGARFRKVNLDIDVIDWGSAGAPLATGHRYEREEIEEGARDIVLQTRSVGIG
jgi:hypothetical protein